MKKKSSISVQLVLITSLLASCQKPNDTQVNGQRVYMRSDTTAPYTEVTQNYNNSRGGSGFGSAFLWYMAFRHLGPGMGYASNGIHPQSVSGTNTAKANHYKSAVRGGFGSKAQSNVSKSSGS